MNARLVGSLLVLTLMMIAACSKQVEVPVKEAAATAADFKQALEQPVTVSETQSPDGGRLTVQFAVIAICKAAGNVPYQFEKSQQLAGQDARRFIAPLEVSGVRASETLANLLGPLNLRYEVDDKGVYLTK